jgi:hypothetical protein
LLADLWADRVLVGKLLLGSEWVSPLPVLTLVEYSLFLVFEEDCQETQPTCELCYHQRCQMNWQSTSHLLSERYSSLEIMAFQLADRILTGYLGQAS